MAQIHLVEGPVGAGKSTYAMKLSKRYKGPHFALDDWMTTLFRPDLPESGLMEWYAERKDRCIKQIWKLTCDLIDSDIHVVLELGLIQKSSRQYLYELANIAGYAVEVYVLEASTEVRRERVKQRNQQKGDTYFMDVPTKYFDLANDMWESPDSIESSVQNIQFISTESR